MKKIKILSLVLAFVSLFAVSCDDDSDPLVQENDIADGTQTFVYSVQVVPSSLNSGRAQGLADVKVTVNQGGETKTKTTNASGIVSFDKMKTGVVSIFIEGPEGFLSVNTEDYLECEECDITELDSEQIEYQQTSITLPRLGATVQGRIFADVDFDGDTEEDEVLPAGTVVLARLYPYFEPNVYTTTTQADGSFVFTNLPEGIEIYLDINFKKVDDNVDPSEERMFYLDDVYFGADVNRPLTLGNIYAYYY